MDGCAETYNPAAGKPCHASAAQSTPENSTSGCLHKKENKMKINSDISVELTGSGTVTLSVDGLGNVRIEARTELTRHSPYQDCYPYATVNVEELIEGIRAAVRAHEAAVKAAHTEQEAGR
jgi:hypothetical protein